MNRIVQEKDETASLSSIIDILARDNNSTVLAYRSITGKGYRVFSKLHPMPTCTPNYGWISLDRVSNSPAYVGDFQESLSKAVNFRKVYSFKNQDEMLKAMVEGRI